MTAEEPCRHAPRVADPVPLGLLGFVLAMLTASLAHLGLQGDGPVFWVGVMFGGVLQIAAGMMSRPAGDDFHFIVFNAFGWHWVCVPGFMLGERLGLFTVSPGEHGAFAVVFAALALLFAAAGASRSTALPITLTLLGAGIALESVTAFGGAAAWTTVGAILLLGAAAGAAYMLVAKFLELASPYRGLPLGPAWVSQQAR